MSERKSVHTIYIRDDVWETLQFLKDQGDSDGIPYSSVGDVVAAFLRKSGDMQ